MATENNAPLSLDKTAAKLKITIPPELLKTARTY